MSMVGGLADALTRDDEMASIFSEDAEIAAMLRIEWELAHKQAELGIIAQDAAERIEAVASSFRPDSTVIQSGMARDGVPVPALVEALREAVGDLHAPAVHKGATSQDVIDTALMLRLKTVLEVLDRRLVRLIENIDKLDQEQGETAFMAYTRMQAALPFTVREKILTWQRPLQSHRARLAELRLELPIQLGGPVGTGKSFGPSYLELRAGLAQRLQLRNADPWQSDRTVVLDFAQKLVLLAGTLGKIGQDVALMAQMGAIKLQGGGSSSAMAHKRNPVGAEVLVALARYTAGLSGTLAQSMIHENERSGAAWTLEWLVLPQIVQATGSAILRAVELTAGLQFQEALRAQARH